MNRNAMKKEILKLNSLLVSLKLENDRLKEKNSKLEDRIAELQEDENEVVGSTLTRSDDE